ncbi:M55 family metallopeptidase [Pelotomaculum propionicicum]|uniref:D-aminopeptidase n=1 Tax=Pelotomaculum propionicicum TaxID=258475 RepID=A0A4Y7RKD6_9FIRM|nr:M55 family metallopeptidase [Pelotomaculum propionicicum]NLI11548.1 M55 family metallopeptidase [Peptococcaceae bacterium]TEB09199.1 D-aminopeptidase [Pelotomaculum propionicicum]
MFKIFIAADIEGTSGYVDWPEKQPEEVLRRDEMIAEVNAAITGALAGGATDIVVSDIHMLKQNIVHSQLLGKASLISGTKKRLMWMDTVQECDLVFLIGFHARCGTAGAVLPHTMNMGITGLRLNGIDAGEAFISAACAGHFGVPLGMASGDRAFVDEIKTLIPGLETVVVKEALGSCAAYNFHPATSAAKITEAAMTAATRGLKGEFKPFCLPEPVEMLLEVTWPGYAEALSLIPGVRRNGGREVLYKGTFLEVMNVISLFVNWIEKKQL